MLLYWGMFTVGFTIGAIFSFVTFAAKKPEEEADYETNDLPRANVSPKTFVLINKKHVEEKMPQLQVTPTPQTAKES